MSKRSVSAVILITVLVILIDALFGPLLRARLAVLPGLRNWSALTSQAPIVINRREVVRDAAIPSFGQTTGALKSQISALVVAGNGQMSVIGTAINVTSDGLFVTAGVDMRSPLNYYSLVLNDNRVIAVKSISVDPATGLVFLQAPANNVPVSPLGNSSELAAGDPAGLLTSTVSGGSLRLTPAYVSSGQADLSRQALDADHPGRAYALTDFSPQSSVSVISSLRSEVIGLLAGTQIISSDVIQAAVSNYLGHNHSFLRPHFGFSYRVIGSTESALTHLISGALITAVAPNSPASLSGLRAGDGISKFNDQSIDDSHGLEEMLEKIKPQQTVRLTIRRGSQTLMLTLTPDVLK